MSNQPTQEEVRAAFRVLEAMSNSKEQVQVTIVVAPMILRFESMVTKEHNPGKPGYPYSYLIAASGLSVGLEPVLCAELRFPDNGGLAMLRPGVMVRLDPEKRDGGDDLEKLYAELSKSAP